MNKFLLVIETEIDSVLFWYLKKRKKETKDLHLERLFIAIHLSGLICQIQLLKKGDFFIDQGKNVFLGVNQSGFPFY